MPILYDVMFASPMFKVGNYPKSTVLPLVKLFNFLVLEQGTSTHPLVGSLTLTLNVVSPSLGLRLVNYLKLEARSPVFLERGADILTPRLTLLV